MDRPSAHSRRQKQELLLGAVLAGSHVRLPPRLCFEPGFCADIAAAIAQCRAAGHAVCPETIAELTGINQYLLDELADAAADVFGLVALDLRHDIERDHYRDVVRRAGERFIAIAADPDPYEFDAARRDLLSAGLLSVPRVGGRAGPLLDLRAGA